WGTVARVARGRVKRENVEGKDRRTNVRMYFTPLHSLFADHWPPATGHCGLRDARGLNDLERALERVGRGVALGRIDRRPDQLPGGGAQAGVDDHDLGVQIEIVLTGDVLLDGDRDL